MQIAFFSCSVPHYSTIKVAGLLSGIEWNGPNSVLEAPVQITQGGGGGDGGTGENHSSIPSRSNRFSLYSATAQFEPGPPHFDVSRSHTNKHGRTPLNK